jgi:aspartyl-tRNA(Asn)/glutamyl-tRNA(Gln) amidotransferase subunit C
LHKQKVYDWPRFFQAFSTDFLVVERILVMSLTRADVENIAHLARLAISEAQLPVYVDSLSKILSFVEQLNAADTASVEPMAHPLAEQVQRLRPDEVLDADRHEKYQQNAPSVSGGLYLVPKVIE